eukprot:5698760-Pleurochrysis_carterae.AAC.2
MQIAAAFACTHGQRTRIGERRIDLNVCALRQVLDVMASLRAFYLQGVFSVDPLALALRCACCAGARVTPLLSVAVKHLRSPHATRRSRATRASAATIGSLLHDEEPLSHEMVVLVDYLDGVIYSRDQKRDHHKVRGHHWHLLFPCGVLRLDRLQLSGWTAFENRLCTVIAVLNLQTALASFLCSICPCVVNRDLCESLSHRSALVKACLCHSALVQFAHMLVGGQAGRSMGWLEFIVPRRRPIIVPTKDAHPEAHVAVLENQLLELEAQLVRIARLCRVSPSKLPFGQHRQAGRAQYPGRIGYSAQTASPTGPESTLLVTTTQATELTDSSEQRSGAQQTRLLGDGEDGGESGGRGVGRADMTNGRREERVSMFGSDVGSPGRDDCKAGREVEGGNRLEAGLHFTASQGAGRGGSGGGGGGGGGGAGGGVGGSWDRGGGGGGDGTSANDRGEGGGFGGCIDTIESGAGDIEQRQDQAGGAKAVVSLKLDSHGRGGRETRPSLRVSTGTVVKLRGSRGSERMGQLHALERRARGVRAELQRSKEQRKDAAEKEELAKLCLDLKKERLRDLGAEVR